MRFHEIIAESDSESHGYWVTPTGEIIECDYATNTHHIDIAKKHFPNSGQPGAYEAGWVRYSQSRMSVAINYHKDVAPASSLRKVARSLARVPDDFTFLGHHKPMEVYIEYARREWSKFDKKAALARLMADAGAVLAEAPLGDYELHGDWENDRHVPTAVIDGGGAIIDPKSPPGGDERSIDPRGNSFASRIDRALVRDPRTEAALRRSLAHLPLTFHLLFLNGPEGIRIAQSYLDSGEHAPGNAIDDALGADMLKRLEELRKSDPSSVIVLLTHNEGGKVRHPLTPWMIVHRLAHASQYTVRWGRHSPADNPTPVEDSISALYQCFDVSVYPNDYDDQVLLQTCTFRSAREGLLTDDVGLEVGCELMTQYMMTGRVTLKTPQALQIGRSTYSMKRRHGQQAQRVTQELEEHVNQSISEYIAQMEGKTYIC